MSKKSDPRNKTFFDHRKAYKAWLGGHGFVAHTAELLNSPAWRYRSLYAARFIDRLELEHLHHNGSNNGFLKLTYRQMREARIHADFIADTIAEVEALGLVTVTHRGAYSGGARNNPSTYRLNYLPWKYVPAAGAAVWYAPTDEWKRYLGKSARQKLGRMHRTGGAFSYRTGGSFKHNPPNPISSDSAKTADIVNAPYGGSALSITRSDKQAAERAPSTRAGARSGGVAIHEIPSLGSWKKVGFGS